MHDFEKIRTEFIEELASRATLYRHTPSGAELLSLETNDENKVFGVAFRTVPIDSTGVAHILEHSVLAGSRKYPVKEPFIELVKGSLASYVNASTFEDMTLYPVASQNLQDFYNLIDVYLDAVFDPLLDKHTFEREGWHLSLDEAESRLKYQGVVFNEMKGQLANPDYTMIKEIVGSLFPDTPYAHQSGGHPASIPDLTFEGFLDFYRAHYHLANARFFFYGDDPPDDRFECLLPYLDAGTPTPETPQVTLQPRFDDARALTISYPGNSGDAAAKHALAMSWMLEENIDPATALANKVLNHILMGTPASPLRKALITSGLGEDVFGSGVDESFGLWTSLRQQFFSVGLKGVSGEAVGQIEPLILSTLIDLASSTLDEAMIEAALNTLEFSLRENNFGAMPRGIILMVRALTTWKFGGDPLSTIAFQHDLESVKASIAADPGFFSSLIRSQLLDNPHRVTLHLHPDPAFLEKLEARERSRLEALSAGLSQDQRAEIITNTKEIQRIQETPDKAEDLAKLPLLTLKDLDPQLKTIPLEVIHPGPGAIWFHPIPSYGISHLDLGFDLHSLPQQYLGYMSVYGRALLEMGTTRQDFVTLSQRIGSQTGGIETTVFSSSTVDAPESQAWLFLRGKAMTAKSTELFGILGDILLNPNFDQQQRFKQIVHEEKARLEASLIPSGHTVINRRLRSGFNEAGWVDELTGGVEALFFLRGLSRRVEDEWPAVLDDIRSIHATLITKNNALFNITCQGEAWPSLESGLRALRAILPESDLSQPGWMLNLESGNEGLVIPAQVNYVGKGLILREEEGSSGALLVTGLLLRTTWLWERVRLQGGAYGAFCLFDPIDRGFTYFSYRDPHVLETLEAFDRASDFLSNLNLDERELRKTTIGTIGRMDAYQLPDRKGFSSMARRLNGMSDAHRQEIRDQVLGVSLPDLQATGDLLSEIAANGRVVIMGSQNAMDEAASGHGPGWIKPVPIL